MMSNLLLAHEGKASWYGEQFHGKITASGHKYNMYQDTAAYHHAPFGSVLKVTNKSNGKSVNVIVTDTGAFERKYGRSIDLSKASFKKIAKLGEGIIDVKIEILDTSKSFKYGNGKEIDEKFYLHF
ncbi:MAG: septal ring lytic transglycosylase RlpA family protein [Aeromonas jandaei]